MKRTSRCACAEGIHRAASCSERADISVVRMGKRLHVCYNCTLVGDTKRRRLAHGKRTA